MSYQKARYIRSRSLSDLLAGELASGEGFGKSIKKVIGLKTKAKITRIKEKFDPLNIIKVLTGGSNLAPALLGRLFGRSQRDIENFAGRSRLAGNKATKIGKLPGQEDTSGLTETLHKIYSFMKYSQEHDRLTREKINDFREEQSLEDQRRHEELIKALGGTPEKRTAMRINDKGGSFLDDLLSAFGLDKGSLKYLKMFGSFLLSPVGLALIGTASFVLLAAWLSDILSDYIKNKVPDMKALSPREAAEMLTRNNPREMDSYGGKEALQEKVKNSKEISENAQKLLEQYNDENSTKYEKQAAEVELNKLGGIKKAQEIAKEGQIKLSTEVEQGLPLTVTPRPDTADGKNKQRAIAWDLKYKKYYDIDGKLKDEFKVETKNNSQIPGSTSTNETPPTTLPSTLSDTSSQKTSATSVENAQKTSATSVENAQKSRSDFAAIDPRRTDRAEPVSTPPASTAVTSASRENQMLQLQSQASSSSSSTTTNNVVNSSASKPKNNILGIDIPAVRNTEDTFRRLSMDSTRLV